MTVLLRIGASALAAATLLSGCGGQPEAAASIPPAPFAPDGWTTIGSFGGEGGAGMTGAGFDDALSGRQVAVHAACTGDGFLVVFIGLETMVGQAGQVPSAVFRCGDAADELRVELEAVPTEADFSVALIEPPSSGRHGAFNVSIEERDD